MKIEKLFIKNFRKHEDLVLEMSDINRLLGRNGQGKSSVGEAIVWLFEGTDVTGTGRQDARLKRAGAADMSVGAICIMDSGLKVTVERIRKDEKTDLKVNGKRSQQSALDIHIGEATTFMSAFWPGYFGGLDPKSGREVLMKLLPPVSPYAVIDNCLPDCDHALLKEYDEPTLLNQTDKIMVDLRKDIADAEAEVQKLQGGLEEAKKLSSSDLLKPPAVVDHKARLSELEKQLIDIKSGGQKTELRNQILGLKNQVLELKSNQQRTVLQNEVSKLEQEVQSLLKEVDRLGAQKKPVPDTHCPTCKQNLPEEQAKKLVDEANTFNTNLSAEVASVRSKGSATHKTLVSKQKELAALPDNTAEITKLETEIRTLEAQLAAPAPTGDTKAIEDEMAKLREEQQQYAVSVREVQIQNKTITDARTRAGKLLDQIEEKGLLLDKLKNTLAAMIRYRVQFAEQQITPLTSHLKKTVLKLYDVVQSTGEMKPVFHVYWTNEDGIRVPYKSLSKSEKVRCNLEISAMISAVTGETYPVFVDDAEGVLDLEKENIPGQVIAAYVSKDVASGVKFESESRSVAS